MSGRGEDMRGVVLGLALAAAAFAAPIGKARAADCWLLEGPGLEQAQKRGECQDAFARNPMKTVPVATSADKAQKSKAPAKTKTKVKAKAPAKTKAKAKARKTSPRKQPDLRDRITTMLATRIPSAGLSQQRPSDHLAYGTTSPRPQR